jgi:hypothetical protein
MYNTVIHTRKSSNSSKLRKWEFGANIPSEVLGEHFNSHYFPGDMSISREGGDMAINPLRPSGNYMNHLL